MASFNRPPGKRRIQLGERYYRATYGVFTFRKVTRSQPFRINSSMGRYRGRVSRGRFSSFDWYPRGGGVWLNASHHATAESRSGIRWSLGEPENYSSRGPSDFRYQLSVTSPSSSSRIPCISRVHDYSATKLGPSSIIRKLRAPGFHFFDHSQNILIVGSVIDFYANLKLFGV